MTQMVLAVCGERFQQGWKVRRYAYLGDAMENDKPKDARYIGDLLNRLGGPSPDDVDTSWIADTKPPKDQVRFFDVYIYLENQGKDNAVYKADYHAYPHCPSEVIDDGMAIYRAIRKEGIRPAAKYRDKVRKMKEAQRNLRLLNAEKERRAELATVRFEIGQFYGYPVKDKFGHVGTGVVQIKGLLKDKGKAVVDIAGGKKNVVADIATVNGEDGRYEVISLRKLGVSVRANRPFKEVKA